MVRKASGQFKELKVIKSYDKQDCIHYQVRDVPSCCGRSHKAGVCTINWRGNTADKTCSTVLKWCKYEKKGAR